MTPAHDPLDPEVYTEESFDTEEGFYPLLDLVARGRLFVLNNKGEREQVELVSYYKDEDLLSVCKQGYEFDQDGTVTRRWHGTVIPGESKRP